MSNTKDEKILTLNALNIIGKKIDVDITKIDRMPELEELTLKNITIDSKLEEKLKTLKHLNRLFLFLRLCKNMLKFEIRIRISRKTYSLDGENWQASSVSAISVLGLIGKKKFKK